MTRAQPLRAAAPRLGRRGALDPRFVAAAREAGCELVSRTGDGVLILVGCERWAEGLKAIEALRQDQRTRAVLCCAAAPPPGLGAELRAAGALSWWGPDAPVWLLQLALQAVAQEPAAPRLRGPAAPEGATGALPAIARRLISAQHAALYQLRDDRWQATHADPPGAAPGQLPAELLDFADQNNELVVIPDTTHAARFDGADPWRCLVVLPLAGHLALVLADEAPRLPHPAALQRLEALRETAELALAWQTERERLLEGLAAGLRVAADDAEHPEEERALIERALHGRLPRGRHLALRATASSAHRGRWWTRDLGPEGQLRQVTADEEIILEAILTGERTEPIDQRAEVVRRDEGPWVELVAAVAPRERSRSVRGDLAAIASELELALRIRRSSADHAAIAHIAALPASGLAPAALLAAIGERVALRLRADGVKITVVSDARGQRLLQQLWRTGADGAERRAVSLSLTEGLADWVVVHNDWLNLQHTGAAEGRPRGEAQGQTGRHGAVTLRPRPVGALWGGALPDAERVQLLVPLTDHNNVVIGVLGVWRVQAAPFHAELDRASLQALAPHVSAALARHIERERTGIELSALQALGPALEQAQGFGEAARLVLDQLVRLAGARQATLVLGEPQRPAVGTVISTTALSPGAAPRPDPRDAGSLRWGAGADHREAALRRRFAEDDEQGLESAPSRVQQVVPVDFGGLEGAVVLLRAERAGEEPSPGHHPGELLGVPLIARAATERAVRAFAGPALAMLHRHLRRRENALVERARAVPADPLGFALAELKSVLDADIAFIATGQGSSHTVERCLGSVELQGLRVDLPGSLRAPQRSPDLFDEDSHRLRAFDQGLLRHIEAKIGRPARSWMSIPLRHGMHLLGGLHLLRLDGSGAFGPEGEPVAAKVVAAAVERSLQIDWLQRQDELDDLIRALAGARADRLAHDLPGRLEAWLRAALHRSVSVYLVAREGNRSLFSCGSSTLSLDDQAALRAQSLGQPGREWREDRPGHTSRATAGPRAAALAAPILLSSDPDLSGHLFVLHSSAFDEDDARRCRELSRALSVLLEGEAIRSRWKLQAGLFRHAMLGPAQGLQSAARKLALLARQAAPSPVEIDEADQRVLIECTALRTWQANQRLLGSLQSGSPPDLHPREAALRPLIDRCIRRYEGAFAERGATVHLRWEPQGALRFAFDEPAVDIMFTNLLDNASKYGFFNRAVSIEVRVDGPDVLIGVESLGAAIPEGAHEALYHPGTRLAARDPLRAIHGEGLGLFLVGLLVEAAGGSVSHTCEAEGEARGPSQAHRVRFALRLPHRWTHRGPPRADPTRRAR
jgi:hypothetical protein